MSVKLRGLGNRTGRSGTGPSPHQPVSSHQCGEITSILLSFHPLGLASSGRDRVRVKQTQDETGSGILEAGNVQVTHTGVLLLDRLSLLTTLECFLEPRKEKF